MPTFSVIDWDAGCDQDMHRVRCGPGGRGKPERVESVAALMADPLVVCLHPEDLDGSWSDAWKLLEKMGRAWDGTLLARAVLPTEDCATRRGLAQRFNLEMEGVSGAACADAAAQIMEALCAELRAQPLAVLLTMEQVLGAATHPIASVVAEAAGEALKTGFGARTRRLEDLFPKDVSGPARSGRMLSTSPAHGVDSDEVCNLFASEGVISAALPSYEYRAEQVRMAREVAEAFNDGLMLMVEAGTGTGKSLAYLAPAIRYAAANAEPVVISTNTKNLQSQLVKKDLPFLERVLGRPFRYALIKGRANYLCLRKLCMLAATAEHELSDEQRVDVLPIIAWVAKTETGDVAEAAGFRGGMASDLWGLLSTHPEECAGGRCRWGRKCFVRAARARAARADIVVANHATIFIEQVAQSSVLPEHRCIIFDEAHNLEDVAANCLATTIAPWRAGQIMNRLFRGRRDGAGRGILPNLLFQLRRGESRMPADTVQRVTSDVERTLALFGGVRAASDALFDQVSALFHRPGREEPQQLRYDAAHHPEGWPALAQAMSDYAETLTTLADAIEQTAGAARGEAKPGVPDVSAPPEGFMASDGDAKAPYGAGAGEVAEEAAAQALRLRALVEDITRVREAQDERFVYWFEGGRPEDAAICAAPISIAGLMDEMIYARMRTAVFVSATLRVGSDFGFMRDRLGLRGPISERTRCVDLGSSFDFPRQVRIGVPLFLPEPRQGGPDFVTPFCDFMIDLMKVTRGRALLLFTSHGMLREAARRMRPALSPEGITVYAQGLDGQREQLLARFRREPGSVLLGTQSFWEGVDVPGEALTCLVLAKLPFRPHTDPLVAARCEALDREGRSAFEDYMVPDAVIRLKQGFGRLIRTRSDRGVVVLCDPRVLKRGYGRAFRDSLPAPVKAHRSAEEALRAVAAFLAEDGGAAEDA